MKTQRSARHPLNEAIRVRISLKAVCLGFATLALVMPREARASSAPPLTDLGTLGGTFSSILLDWNHDGRDPGAGQPARPKPRSMNAAGQVIGYSRTAGNASSHAFVWDATHGMQDLGTLGFSASHPVAINDAGQVIGYAYTAGDGGAPIHAFVWDATNGMQDLTPGAYDSYPVAINAAGQVIGYAYTLGLAGPRAFLWDATNGLRDLGTLGGTYSRPYAINAAGQVAGQSSTAGDAGYRAFVWDSVNGMRDLGTFGGDWSYAYYINAAGQVIGQASRAGFVGPHAFVWDAVNGLQDLSLGGDWSEPIAINDAGQVIGWGREVENPDAGVHAFVWDATNGLRDLGTLGGHYSRPAAINAAGQVIGLSAPTGDVGLHAFVWDETLGMRDLGTFGGDYSEVIAQNDSGQVVGQASIAGNAGVRAFVWDAAHGVQDLGTLGGDESSPFAINASGQVVGTSSTTGNAAWHAFAWDAIGGMQDLGTLGGGDCFAAELNDAGHVAGLSSLAGDIDYHAFSVRLANTPAGSTVAVQPVDTNGGGTPVGLTFSQVTESGNTSLTTGASGPTPPAGFNLGSPATYYDLTTTAVFSGQVAVCINYTGISYTDESALRLFHFEGGAWVDVTSSVDTINNVICGSVTSLSPFAIFEPVGGAAQIFYLRGTGPNSNPPTLFLNTTAPSATTPKFKDSAANNFNGGNPWKEVGTWLGAAALTSGTLTSVSDLHVWLGLKNSDDQGTRFDLRIEIRKNGSLVAAGETHAIQGVVRNPNLAKEVSVAVGSFSATTFNGSSDQLSLKILTRIGTNGSDGFSGGHSNATGLRLYFDANVQPARFTAVF